MDFLNPSKAEMDALVGQPLLYGRDLTGLLRLVAISGLHFLKLDGHLIDRPGELEGYFVRLGDWRAFIRTHVGAFIRRERAALGLIYTAGSSTLTVDGYCSGAALTLNKPNMQLTLTQSGALYLAHHKSSKHRSALFRQLRPAGRKQSPDLSTAGSRRRLLRTAISSGQRSLTELTSQNARSEATRKGG